MFKSIILLTFILSVSCSKPKVTIIKQWHLSPHESTKDIEASKKLPQYENQINIYNTSLDLIEKGSEVVIAEGCEKVDTFYKSSFNGWDLGALKTTDKLVGIQSVLAPVPLKLKARLGDKIEIVCGDNDKIIKQNNLAFSDLKGYVNFYQRLMEYKNKDQKSYDKYRKALNNIVDIKEGQDAIIIARNLALKSLALFQKHIEDRNLYFLKKIIDHRGENPILIVGGLHVKGIAAKLKEAELDFEIIEPKGYPKEEDRLIDDLLVLLREYKKEIFIAYQVPEYMDLKSFPIKNPIEELTKTKVFAEMKPYLEKLGLDPNILACDFDKDGIRDFTISTSEGITVLSAEDNDWDNDGVVNLLDEKIGDVKAATININAKEISNDYSVEGVGFDSEIKKINDRDISLIQTEGIKHDILILKIFNEVLSKVSIPKKSLLTFVAKKPSFTYGKRSFFSYNKQSKSLEVYPQELLHYLSVRKKREFPKVKNGKFVNMVVVPLLIHSLAHEVGHMQAGDHEKTALLNGWSWKENSIDNVYLQKYRLEFKKINNQKSDIIFNGEGYQELLKQHQEYLSFINKLLKNKRDPKVFKDSVKESKWFVETKREEREFQTSFLINKKAPSLYALSSPKEWYAEVYASCIFRKFFPQVKKVSEAIRYELLIGLNPMDFNSFCQ
jgi:hypothetical protein